MHAGLVSTTLGLPAIPAEAEQLMIARDLLLNRTINCRYHVQHISTAWSVELVRRGKRDGQAVTSEVAPHHLLLTDEACRGYDTNFKMNPPLRTQADMAACIEGVKDGTIDAIATDHAPHHADEKALEYDRAPFGITGLETALGLALNELVHKGIIGLERLVEMCSTNPAKIFRLKGRGTLTPGSIADITIIDPAKQWTFNSADSRSRSRNTPFDGWHFNGKAVATIIAGKVVQNEVDRSERQNA
jgi:dihydroorotase